MTNVVIEAKCNFCKETIKFEENDFELSFELSLKQIKESEV